MIKKISAILMAVIMVFGVTQIAFAADGAVYDPETGNYIENGFSYWISDDEDFSGIYVEDYVGTDDIIYIPKTLGGYELSYWDIDAWLFGASNASAFSVDADNESFSVKDGVLFSKDGTTLVAYPNGKAGDSYDIPEGVENITTYCFLHSSLKEVTFPSTIVYVGFGAFGESFNDFFSKTDGLIYSGSTLLNYSYNHIPDTITVKDGTQRIADYALPNGCIVIPDSVTEIGEQSFSGYLCGSEGSAAQKFAEENDIDFIVLGEGHVHSYFYDYNLSDYSTCVSNGTGVFTCPCGEKYEVTLALDPYGHEFDDDDNCIYCGKNIDELWKHETETDCNCKCHDIEHSYAPSFSGIFSFLSDLFFRLKLVFWHLTGTHQYCECGCRHY